jgi:hypothetical protein
LFKRLAFNPALEEVVMKRKVSVFLVMGVTLLLVCALFGSQSIVNAKENWPTVPFKVNCVTYPDVMPGPGYLEVKIPSDCKGTHIGNGEWYADSMVDLTVPPPFAQTGDMVFTAANGDQLIGTFAGLSTPKVTGGFDYWGEYWITEGTGRFSGTTGYGTYDGGADGEVGTAVFVGTLTKKPGHFGNQ